MNKEFLGQIDRVGELVPETLLRLDDSTLICECFCISAGDIRETCSNNQVVDLLALSLELGLGTGCAGCVNRLDSWIQNIF